MGEVVRLEDPRKRRPTLIHPHSRSQTDSLDRQTRHARTHKALLQFDSTRSCATAAARLSPRARSTGSECVQHPSEHPSCLPPSLLPSPFLSRPPKHTDRLRQQTLTHTLTDRDTHTHTHTYAHTSHLRSGHAARTHHPPFPITHSVLTLKSLDSCPLSDILLHKCRGTRLGLRELATHIVARA